MKYWKTCSKGQLGKIRFYSNKICRVIDEIPLEFYIQRKGIE